MPHESRANDSEQDPGNDANSEQQHNGDQPPSSGTAMMVCWAFNPQHGGYMPVAMPMTSGQIAAIQAATEAVRASSSTSNSGTPETLAGLPHSAPPVGNAQMSPIALAANSNNSLREAPSSTNELSIVNKSETVAPSSSGPAPAESFSHNIPVAGVSGINAKSESRQENTQDINLTVHPSAELYSGGVPFAWPVLPKFESSRPPSANFAEMGDPPGTHSSGFYMGNISGIFPGFLPPSSTGSNFHTSTGHMGSHRVEDDENTEEEDLVCDSDVESPHQSTEARPESIISKSRQNSTSHAPARYVEKLNENLLSGTSSSSASSESESESDSKRVPKSHSNLRCMRHDHQQASRRDRSARTIDTNPPAEGEMPRDTIKDSLANLAQASFQSSKTETSLRKSRNDDDATESEPDAEDSGEDFMTAGFRNGNASAGSLDSFGSYMSSISGCSGHSGLRNDCGSSKGNSLGSSCARLSQPAVSTTEAEQEQYWQLQSLQTRHIDTSSGRSASKRLRRAVEQLRERELDALRRGLTPDEVLPPRDPLTGRRRPGRRSRGCWTCKCRRKKCDERQPSCEACEILGLRCDGYESKRPDFMVDSTKNTEYREYLSRVVRAHKHKYGHRVLEEFYDQAPQGREPESDDEHTGAESGRHKSPVESHFKSEQRQRNNTPPRRASTSRYQIPTVSSSSDSSAESKRASIVLPPVPCGAPKGPMPEPPASLRAFVASAVKEKCSDADHDQRTAMELRSQSPVMVTTTSSSGDTKIL